MILFILLVVLTILFWVATVVSDKHGNDASAYVHAVFACFASVGLLFSVIYVCTLPGEAESFAKGHEVRANLVESINDTMSTETVNEILNDAIEANDRIELHRRHVDGKFLSWYYSHKIADLELIPIPKIGVITTTTE